MRVMAPLMMVLLLGVLALTQSLFIVDEREQALVLQLGQPVGDVKQPGLHFKLPVVQDVRRFDARILSVDPEPRQMVVSSSSLAPGQNGADPDSFDAVSGEPIVVDVFARYRITDPLLFLKTLQTVFQAQSRLEGIINDTTRNVLGRTTLEELLSPARTQVMQDIRTRVNNKIAEDTLGIEIIDIRIVRTDLTPALRQSTVRRMISELRESATETRARGEEQALEIRSRAEKEREIILAEAQRDSQIIRGQGDREAITIYAGAFNKDREFYDFMRSLEAYRNTLANPETRLILSPDSPFFRHFQGE